MKKYLLRKALMIVPVAFGVSFLSFILLYFTPGDPAEIILRENGIHDPSDEMIAEFRARSGLDAPVLVQYARWAGRAFRGDFGLSLKTGETVAGEFRDRFPATLELALLAEGLALVIAVAGGTLSALYRGKALDHVLRALGIAGISMPTFWLGAVLILIFSVYLRCLPVFGRRGALSYVLPVLTLSLPIGAYLLRLVRASLLEVLRRDFMTTAEAKGLPGALIFWKHGFRNAMLPVVTVIGLQIANLCAGTVIVETIFAWPGIGRFLVEAILARDFPVIRGFVFLIALMYIGVNFLTDIAYALIDPRIAARMGRP